MSKFLRLLRADHFQPGIMLYTVQSVDHSGPAIICVPVRADQYVFTLLGGCPFKLNESILLKDHKWSEIALSLGFSKLRTVLKALY